jgi:hypothetical protein
MTTPKTANDDAGMVTGMFYDRDSAERAYRSIIGRGYTQDEINLAMADETRKVLFPEEGLVTELGEKAAKEGVDLGNPKGGTLATLTTAVSAIGAAGALLLLPGIGVVLAGPITAAIAGAGGSRRRRRTDRRSAALGHSRVANGRVSRRNRERRHPHGTQAPLERGCAVLRAGMESPSREPGSRLGERAPVTTEPSHSSCSCAPKLSSPVSALLAREPIANGRMSRCWSCAGIAAA